MKHIKEQFEQVIALNAGGMLLYKQYTIHKLRKKEDIAPKPKGGGGGRWR